MHHDHHRLSGDPTASPDLCQFMGANCSLQMKRLEDLPLIYRILLAIAIVLATLLVLLILNRFVGEDAEAQGVPDTVPIGPEHMCMDDESRERIRTIMAQALDDGLHAQIAHLYETWVRDFKMYGEGLAPARKGARNAILAYQASRASLIEWNPPACK
jgi:hypothetical protein